QARELARARAEIEHRRDRRQTLHACDLGRVARPAPLVVLGPAVAAAGGHGDVRPPGAGHSRSVPPQPAGSTSSSVSENVQRWPAGSSAAYWRSPYSKSVGSIRICAPWDL